MLVNWVRIEAFVDKSSEEDLLWLKTSIADLIQNLDGKRKQINSLMANSDYSLIQPILHQIKGVAANFGLEDFCNVAREAETLLKENQIKEFLSIMDRLSTLWESTKSELETRL